MCDASCRQLNSFPFQKGKLRSCRQQMAVDDYVFDRFFWCVGINSLLIDNIIFDFIFDDSGQWSFLQTKMAEGTWQNNYMKENILFRIPTRH